MKNIILILFLFTHILFQDKLPYDISKVTNEKEIHLTNKRGISYKGVVYYVENDLNTITAYKKDKIKWRSSLLGIIEPAFGEPVIRFMKIKEKTLYVTYAKHDFYEINIETGKVDYFGSD